MSENTNERMKGQVISGIFWRFGERIGAQFVSFIVSIVLARLLLPSDYGSIAMIMIFINIADVFANCGFATALVQKKNADKKDFSTIFYFSLIMSLFLYIILFIAAPYIGEFYSEPILVPTLRVMALRIPIAGVNSVQQAYVSRNMMFKKFFFSTLGGTLASAVIGIVLAYQGFGVWALVAQYLANSTIDTMVLWFTARWRPTIQFSFKSLKGLFSFGWKMLCSELLNTTYEQFRSLVIGKIYTSEDLAYYSKGKQFPQIIVSNVNSSISSVVFPVMSKVQDDKERLKQQVRRSVRVSSYIMWPLMIGMAVMAEPIISLLLTEKWLPCTIFLQLNCLQLALEPVQTANLQAIKAMGRSDLFLKMEILKKIVAIISVLLVMKISVLAIAVVGFVYTLFATYVNSTPNRKLLNYSLKEQVNDLITPIILSIIMGIPVYLLNSLDIYVVLKMVIQISLGSTIYISLSAIFKIDSFQYLLEILKSYINKFRKNK